MERKYPYRVRAPCGKEVVYWSAYAPFTESQAKQEDVVAIGDHSSGCFWCALATRRQQPVDPYYRWLAENIGWFEY